MSVTRLLLGFVLLLSNLFVLANASPRTLRVAVASNLTRVIDAIDHEYELGHSDIKIIKIVGSTGQLVAQIEQGAPVDLLLSADASYVNQLITTKIVDSNHVYTFTQGILVLWTRDLGLDLLDLKSSLLNNKVARIAIANPKTAPFGRAAQQVIKNLKLQDVLTSKLVTAESVAQAAQFVQSSNAQLGFVALSSIFSLPMNERGRWLVIAPEFYEPLEQTALVLSKGGQSETDAQSYALFLKSQVAQKILADYGYKSY